MEKKIPNYKQTFYKAVAAQMVNKYGKMSPEKGKLKQDIILYPVLAN